MAEINKPTKKLQKLKFELLELDQLRNTIIKVIEQGGNVEMEWENTGLEYINFGGLGCNELTCNGSQKFTFIIPPHKTKSLCPKKKSHK